MKAGKKYRVCIAEALYPMLLYLLISSEDEIRRTIFIVDYRIESRIIERLPHVVFEDITKDIYLRSKWAMCLYGWWLRFSRFRFMNHADIYGLDFKWYLLNKLHINYIEDAPNIFNLWETSPMYRQYLKSQNIKPWKRKLRKLIFGDFFRNPVATSDSVNDVYVTAPSYKPYLKGKNQVVVDMASEWNNSPEGKKQLILSIFDISNSDLEDIKKKKVMLLTQAFYDDKMVTEDEQIKIYRKILDNYDHNEVIIKAHPRDRLDYRKAFPDIMYFDKVVPLQFLSIIGIKFSHVATVSSSSALSFGDNIKIDWYGGGVHPAILKAEGVRTLDDALKNYREQNGLKR